MLTRLMNLSLVCGAGALVGIGCVVKTSPQHRTGDTDGGVTARPAAQLPDGGAGREDSSPGTSRCIPTSGPDLPDDQFVDSNCDGIDGDLADAIFVSPTGQDGALGTLAAPVATVQKGAELAASQHKSSVYLCNAVYPENVRIAGAGVSLYGGYDCAKGWARSSEPAEVAPSTGVPLTIEGGSAALVVANLVFRAANNTEPEGSSIAALVSRSVGVTFSHTRLIAGDAGAGINGAPLPDPHWSVPDPGADAPGVSNASVCFTATTDVCTTFSSGMDGCWVEAPGADGPARTCPHGDTVQGGRGGWGGNCTMYLPGGGNGYNGSPPGNLPLAGDGAKGSAGVPAAAGFGRFASGRYFGDNAGHDGAPGTVGNAGMGGPGGISRMDPTATSPTTLYWVGTGGGQGGYPGCPGDGGRGGRGGGASIALVVLGGPAHLVGSLLHTGHGGSGGTPSGGAPGQRGGLGGHGGIGTNTFPGHDGQAAGAGGAGGPGGAGGGGPSIGILSDGADIVVESTPYELGSGGTGATAASGKAADGISVQQYTIPRQ